MSAVNPRKHQTHPNTNRPFGGRSVIVCGDLFQLPPIGRDDEPHLAVYNSMAWKTFELFELEGNPRITGANGRGAGDADNASLAEALAAMRVDQCTSAHQRLLRRAETPAPLPDLDAAYLEDVAR